MHGQQERVMEAKFNYDVQDDTAGLNKKREISKESKVKQENW